jgi:hypothetical protein
MRFSVPGFRLCRHIADGEVAKVTDFLSGFAMGFASFAFVLILWNWIKWALSGNWLV